MDHGTFEELKDAYVLGALPEAERREFEEFLAAHPEYQAEVDELGGIAGLLAFAPAEHEAPPEVRRRVMDVVESEAVPARAARRESGSSPWLGRYAAWRNLALGAATLLIVGLLSWNVLLQRDVQDLRGQVQEARVQVEEAQSQGAQTIAMQGSWAEQGTRAEVARIEDDRVILVAENVPSVPDDRTCQIWVIRGDVPQPSGLFDPADDMTATAITRPLNEGDTVAVTVEPAGGSEQPTTDPVLLTEL